MKISIITPTYNRKELLLETIQTIQNSVLVPLTDVVFEHIIYDDCSTDGTFEYFQTHTFPHTTYIRGEKNMGQTIAKNKAIEQSTGDFIMILDSDDGIVQRALYHFAEAIKNNPTTEWFVAEYLRMDKDFKYVVGKDYYGWAFDNCKEILKAIFSGMHFIQSNTMFSRKLFDAVGGFNEGLRMGEELDLYIRFLFQDKNPLYCSFISHLVRLHETNMTKDFTLTNHFGTIAGFREKYKKELEERGILNA